CIQEYKFELYENNGDIIKNNINEISSLDLTYLPESNKEFLENTFINAILTFELVENLKKTQSKLYDYGKNYRSLHLSVRKIQKKQFKIDYRIKKLEKEKRYLERENQTNKVNKIQSEIDELNNENIEIVKKIPSNWEVEHNEYKALAMENKKAVTKYRRNVDSVYENIRMTKLIIIDKNKLNIDSEILNLKEIIFNESKDDGMNRIKSIEKILNEIAGAELIKEKLSKARRSLKKDDADINKINTLL
ncbi:uncharacterized protein METZ01_LOCUS468501, partial [marine metagenome]